MNKKNFMFPESTGWAITSYFKDPEYKATFKEEHYGIDIAYQRAHFTGVKNIFAVLPGVVAGIQRSTSPSVANAVRLEHKGIIKDKMIITRYYHLSSISENIKKGATVSAGDILGIEGKTGNATGSHLHFEMWITPENYKWNYRDSEKYAVDPLEYLILLLDQECVHDPENKVKRDISNNEEYEKLKKEYSDLKEKYNAVKSAIKILKEI